MQFEIKEMKGKAEGEWFYKQDSPGALRRQFCKRLWAWSPRKDGDGGGGSAPGCSGMRHLDGN